jgi:hypothetical protein
MSAADAGVGQDGGDGGSIGINLDTGMGLVFVAKDTLPSEHDRNGYRFHLDSAEMNIMNLRLVADSVADGDERTTLQLLRGVWDQSRPEVPALYPDAPPGLYSRIRGTVVALEINGEVQLSDMDYHQMELEAKGLAVPIEMTIDYNLEIGAPLVLEVEVDFEKIVDEIEFENLPTDDGELATNGQAVTKMEEKLVEAFRVVGEY